ncbi:hypothetical protein ACFQV2_08555 [Actinokineospora soli]|uniref:Fibronectin type-III domain-containing protein n=1 Tax=Actinokineospora soli TaxID=1048753 RepID=A0ABW2TM46_9PSEU
MRVRFDEAVIPETGPVGVSGPGWLDPQVFPSPGPVDFHVVSVSMDLRVRGGGIGPDDPFHVPCTLDPGQRTVLGTVQVFPIITEPPSPPGDVRITDVTHDTAVLAWTPSPRRTTSTTTWCGSTGFRPLWTVGTRPASR